MCVARNVPFYVPLSSIFTLFLVLLLAKSMNVSVIDMLLVEKSLLNIDLVFFEKLDLK